MFVNTPACFTLTDICPKGWRLPTQADYQSLISVYTDSAAIMGSPWNGYNYAVGYGTEVGWSSGGRYWTSQPMSGDYSYTLSYTAIAISATSYVHKRAMVHIRCVKK